MKPSKQSIKDRATQARDSLAMVKVHIDAGHIKQAQSSCAAAISFAEWLQHELLERERNERAEAER